VKEQTFSHKPVQKEFIQKIRPRIEQCLNEGGKCPILPDFAHIYDMFVFQIFGIKIFA
jgi:hypothetical protein